MRFCGAVLLLIETYYFEKKLSLLYPLTQREVAPHSEKWLPVSCKQNEIWLYKTTPFCFLTTWNFGWLKSKNLNFGKKQKYVGNYTVIHSIFLHTYSKINYKDQAYRDSRPRDWFFRHHGEPLETPRTHYYGTEGFKLGKFFQHSSSIHQLRNFHNGHQSAQPNFFTLYIFLKRNFNEIIVF